MDWLKIIANLTGIADLWSKYFNKKADEAVGAKLQQGATDAATLQAISAVSRPDTVAERDELWNRNKAKYSSPAIHGEWDGE